MNNIKVNIANPPDRYKPILYKVRLVLIESIEHPLDGELYKCPDNGKIYLCHSNEYNRKHGWPGKSQPLRIRPILISLEEKVENGDLQLNHLTNKVSFRTISPLELREENCSKVILVPTRITTHKPNNYLDDFISDIVGGKLRDGDEFYLACERDVRDCLKHGPILPVLLHNAPLKDLVCRCQFSIKTPLVIIKGK